MELAAPITIYWDLPFDHQDTDLLRRTCADVSNCRPLMLQIYSDNVLAGDGLLFVLQQLRNSEIAVTITIPARILSSVTGDLFHEAGAKELLIYAESLADLTEVIDFTKMAGSQVSLGISFSVTRSNWQQLPDVVSFCRKNGIGRLVLPMQRLYKNESPFFISSLEQQELSTALAETDGIAGLSLTIHDPFLWRAFNPTAPFPQAGCQAANTMIAIAPDGWVYPCPTLPVQLGNINESTLKEIIFSPIKKQLRRSLTEHPGECRDCSEVAVCRGGCRGRGLVLQGTLDGLDPACK